jgi:hypothetical protein
MTIIECDICKKRCTESSNLIVLKGYNISQFESFLRSNKELEFCSDECFASFMQQCLSDIAIEMK